MGRHVDFWQVTGDALDYAMEAVGLDDAGLRDRLMDLYLSLEAYPEVREMLQSLQAKGLKTAILSNGSPDMLDAAARNAGIAGYLDAILSVEEVGIFKPAPVRLPARRGSARAQGLRHVVPVVERVGCRRGGRVRLQGGVGQPLRPGARKDSRTPRTSSYAPCTPCPRSWVDPRPRNRPRGFSNCIMEFPFRN